MSFFRKEPRDKAEFIEMERKHDEEKRKRFLESQDSGEEKKGFMFGEKIRDFKRGRRVKKEQKVLREIEKEKERKERQAEEELEIEKRVHGRVLTREEREEFMEEKEERKLSQEVKKAQRRAKAKEFFEKTERGVARARKVGAQIGERNIFDSGGGVNLFGTGGSGTVGKKSLGNVRPRNAFGGLTSNKSILDISGDIGPAKLDFELNFGNMLTGKRKKKVGKHPLSI